MSKKTFPIKLLTSVSGSKGAFRAGEEYPCDSEKEAKAMIKAGIGEAVGSKKETTKKKTAKKETADKKQTEKSPAEVKAEADEDKKDS